MTVQSGDPAPPAPAWRVVGASVIGTAHTRAGMPCQDAHRWLVLPDGSLVITVADGAGSAARADEGAHLAVDAAIAALTDLLQEGLPTDETTWSAVAIEAFGAAHAAIDTHAEGMHTTIRDYATTLTIVVATDGQLVVGQIGDGLAVAEGDDGEMFVAVSPQRGEYANEVALLTMPEAVENVAVALFTTPVRAVAVTTDGLLRLAVRLPSYAPHVPFFRPLFAFLKETTDAVTADRALAAFLASERIAQRTDDDKTLVLAVRVADEGVGTGDLPQPLPTEAPNAG